MFRYKLVLCCYIIFHRIKTETTICMSEHYGKIYRVPQQLNCKNQTYIPWTIAIDTLNIQEYESPAKSLTIYRKTCTTYTDFLGSRTVTKTTKMITIEISMAQQVVELNKCVDPDMNIVPMNSHDFNCKYSWLKHETTTVIACHINSGVVIATHTGHFVSSLSNMEGCNYRLGRCKTHNSKHVFWTIIDNVDKEYLHVGYYNATQIGYRLLVPEITMSFTIPEELTGNTWIDGHFQITGQPIKPDVSLIQSSNEDTIEAIRQELAVAD